eukprot:3771253-Prymnesium_polylepis.1
METSASMQSKSQRWRQGRVVSGGGFGGGLTTIDFDGRQSNVWEQNEVRRPHVALQCSLSVSELVTEQQHADVAADHEPGKATGIDGSRWDISLIGAVARRLPLGGRDYPLGLIALLDIQPDKGDRLAG